MGPCPNLIKHTFSVPCCLAVIAHSVAPQIACWVLKTIPYDLSIIQCRIQFSIQRYINHRGWFSTRNMQFEAQQNARNTRKTARNTKKYGFKKELFKKNNFFSISTLSFSAKLRKKLRKNLQKFTNSPIIEIGWIMFIYFIYVYLHGIADDKQVNVYESLCFKSFFFH